MYKLLFTSSAYESTQGRRLLSLFSRLNGN